MEVPSSKRFAEQRNEILLEAIWSDLESVVLHEICKEVKDRDSICKVYNDIVYYSSTSYYVYGGLPQNITQYGSTVYIGIAMVYPH